MSTIAMKKEFIKKGQYVEVITRLTEWTWGRTNGVIKKTILRKDIERGVKFLNEQAYSNHAGSTKSSALFCLELKKHIDLTTVYRVDMAQTNKHHYTVRLYTTDGYTIQLKGCSFGYWGEGSRGSLAVLHECGFKKEQINKIFTHGITNVRLLKRGV